MSDKVLFFIFDLFPIALALIGIIISYHSPKSKAVKIVVTICLLLAGAGGCAALLTFHLRNDHAHATEVAQLNAKIDAQSSKIDAYNRNNERVLNRLTKPSARSISPPANGSVRRQKSSRPYAMNMCCPTTTSVLLVIRDPKPPVDWVVKAEGAR
jgi:glucan phosphoethanolaminetransferase (alkaline phosphatase superfamily)